MKRWLVFCCAALLCLLPCMARAEGEAAEVYHIVDASGAFLTQYAGTPEAGDVYIAHDNRQYVLTRVDVSSHTAWAQDQGIYPMPDVTWLEEDS